MNKLAKKLKVLRNPHSPITKLLNEGLDSKGIVCELIACGECGFKAFIPQPLKQLFECECSALLDSCATVRLKAIPLLPTIKVLPELKVIHYKKHVKRNRKNS